MNPVFDADHFAPRRLGPTIATVGLRDAEDIPTMLGFCQVHCWDSNVSRTGTVPRHSCEENVKSQMSL